MAQRELNRFEQILRDQCRDNPAAWEEYKAVRDEHKVADDRERCLGVTEARR